MQQGKTKAERRLSTLVEALQNASRDEQQAGSYAEDVSKRIIAVESALQAVKAELKRQKEV